MFHDRGLNNKINRIHKRALRITYKDSQSDLNTLLAKDNSVSVHHRNLQLLITEVYKTQANLNPPFMKNLQDW